MEWQGQNQTPPGLGKTKGKTRKIKQRYQRDIKNRTMRKSPSKMNNVEKKLKVK